MSADTIPDLSPLRIPIKNSNTGQTEFRQLTWKEAYSYQQEERILLSKWYAIVNSLNRCEHGRHEGDICDGCKGYSHGNPLLPADRIIGFTIDGKAKPIKVPTLEDFRSGDPGAWTR